MIKRYSTRKIDGRNPYARDISLIVSRHRGVATEASVLKLEGTASLLVFIIGNHVVATLRYFKKGIAVYVNLVHVLQEHRGRGYSVKLFQHLFHIVKSNIELEVEKNNDPAISLYKKLGFAITGDNKHGELKMLKTRH